MNFLALTAGVNAYMAENAQKMEYASRIVGSFLLLRIAFFILIIILVIKLIRRL